MKTKLIAALCIVFSTGSLAATKEEYCVSYAEVAENVMLMRQDGTSILKQLEVAGDSEFIKEIILRAYKVNQYNSREVKKRAVNKFVSDSYFLCMKS